MLDAIRRSVEWGDRIPIGVFYNNEEIPTYEERMLQRMPEYMDVPPAKQRISDSGKKPIADITPFMDELSV